MRSIRIVAVALFPCLLSTSALADWYSGDPYSAQTAWPQYTDGNSNVSGNFALTYDNFTWVPGAGGGVVDVVGGHFHSFGQMSGALIDVAQWEIRTGMSHNNGGTLVAAGSGTVTSSATSFLQGGAAVTQVSVDITDFTLAAGNYWFGLAIGSTSVPSGWFVASTTGTNGVGGPLGDDLSIYYQSNNFGANVSWNYVESAIVNPGFTGFDPSYFILEAPVPGPGGVGMLIVAALAGGRRRRTA